MVEGYIVRWPIKIGNSKKKKHKREDEKLAFDSGYDTRTKLEERERIARGCWISIKVVKRSITGVLEGTGVANSELIIIRGVGVRRGKEGGWTAGKKGKPNEMNNRVPYLS